MREFEFLEPSSVQEASALLGQLGEDCRVMAGGTALMLVMRQRMVAPAHIVSIGKIESLRGITFDAARGLRIGALTLHSEVARSAIVQERYPMLARMAEQVANPQVRNQGTIGGNLCYADPATDPPSCLMALDAEVVLDSTRGERVLKVESFFVDYFTTALEFDEIVTEIRLPPPAFTDGRHVRFLRTAAEHRPLVNVAITVKQCGKVCESARIVIGASTAIPTRIGRCEAFLAGRAIEAGAVAEAARIIADDINPISDIRGSDDYRRAMVQVVSRRALASVFGLSAGH